MLDSKSDNLRPKYLEISTILVDSKRFSVRDSLLGLIYVNHKLQKHRVCAELYQDFFEFIDKEGVYDSLKRAETPHLYETIAHMYEADPSFETFAMIDKFKYSDRAYIEKLRKHIETGFEQQILQLSCEMDVGKLLDFQAKYPGVYTSDIESLLEKAKDKYRLTIIRKPTIALVKSYYDKFGGPDDELENALEKTMYDAFIKDKSKETADTYASRFPKGKNIIPVQEFLIKYAWSENSANKY
jgi:hypothetical protein